ncbi:hypothetical protein EST38_g12088 [Candolleomyces aberdarensis]|uniref:Uncharacterized protein n=1 Tax=Candolleomyces aberdarensis TaxID=2316362 RepID=A0A4Q2D5H5_9AGAR|nr:hypothetical protein EST38_g12088 [Candolleomyces aberdarensis]
MTITSKTSVISIGRTSIESSRTTPGYGSVGNKAVRDAVGVIDECARKIRVGCSTDEYTQVWHDVMLSVVVLELAVERERLSSSVKFEAEFWIKKGPIVARISEDYQKAWRDTYEGHLRELSTSDMKAGRRMTAPAPLNAE